MKTQLALLSALGAIAAPAVAQAPTAAPVTAVQPAANLTRQQVLTALNEAFVRVDTNKDGFISLAEANAAQARVAAQAAAQMAARAEAEFHALDTDKNGQLSLAEFKAGVGKVDVAPGDEIIKALDANRDGKISAQEFQSHRLSEFDRLDTNHDGILSPQERQAAAAAQH